MNQLKFRAWIEEDKKMYDVLSVFAKYPDEDFHRVFINKPPVEGEVKNYRMEGGNYLMQHIGLKDKNNTEIYASDVVRLFGGGLRKVVFDIGAFGYYVSENEPHGYFVSFAGNNNFEWLAYKSNHIEVIGNIHQHPELLNQPA
jgi:uncharacterized phage protein (TIGR01671 family)